ncbi:hypothetical protein [Paenibacillus humicus]|uniref:hypothetical protein n=1 Tax=Paenibacillus humicus TaxID=412861 RepID=UPI003F18A343
MQKTLSTLIAIRTSSMANLVIYYLQKLPLVGKRIPDRLYAKLGAKKILSAAAFLLSLLGNFAGKLAFVGLFLYLPVSAVPDLSGDERWTLFLHLFFLTSFVAAGVSAATILEPKREKYVAVKLMRLSPARYMKAALAYRYAAYFVFYVPVLIIFALALGAGALDAILLAAALTLWRIFMEYLHLLLYDRKGIILIKKVGLVWIVICLSFAAAYAPLLSDAVPAAGAWMLSRPIQLVMAAAGLLAAVRLWRYKQYRRTVDAAAKRDDPLLDVGRMMSEAQKTSVQSKDSDYTLQSRSKLEGLEGYRYLNAIFFARHRSLLVAPVKMRLIIIGAGGALLAAAALAFREQLDGLGLELAMVYPYLLLGFNFIAVGEKMCKAMFYHCDLSLMRHSFYRSAASQHFRLRLVRIAAFNLLIAAALGTVLAILQAAAGNDWLGMEIVLLWISVLFLSLFYSVHHLFMYYFFQPYSTELNVKNPLYFIFSLFISMLGGACIVLKPAAGTFASLAAGLALVYLAAALLIIRRSGQRTFRVK